MRILRVLLLPLTIAALLACGCRTADKTPEITTALQQVIAGKAPAPDQAVWNEVRGFYQQRADKPAWVEHKYTTDRATEALQVVRAAREHGLDPEEYGEAGLVKLQAALTTETKDAPDRFQRLAEFETRMTSALLEIGHDVATGRTTPSPIDGRWKANRKSPDIAATLAKAVDGDLAHWLDTIQPPHPEYSALRKAFMDLHGQKEKGGWPAVPADVYKRGQSGPAVAALRQRLAVAGELKTQDANNAAATYDGDVETAVKAFQELHGIKATGLVDKPTLAALNISIDERLRQVALNLERWRWLPDDLGARHLFVNIPFFHLVAREDGKPVMDIRVVVGKPGNETPIFSDEMETVVFSPYWNIPDSIKQGETAPAVMRDPSYLERNNIEIRRGSQVVSASSVNWSDPGELRQLAFRQRPGANNALGHVKFLFPNKYDVYLHDTPADSLFARPGRAFSHGCVRVEEPEVLANYILRGYSEWNGPRIITAMHSGDEQHVKLKETIPVHIVYFTSWVDDNGGLHFQPDIYGYDAKQDTPKLPPAQRPTA
jgi:murein L,D-transpeptidase YcbB/YkuD